MYTVPVDKHSIKLYVENYKAVIQARGLWQDKVVDIPSLYHPCTISASASLLKNLITIHQRC